MTQKELAYFEDAVSHECNIIKILEVTKSNLQDEKLINFTENELNIHKNMKEKLMNLLEAKVNE